MMGSAFKTRTTGSGPKVVRLYLVTLALIWVVAWWSWGLQALALVGEQGLAPMGEFFARARTEGSQTPLSAPSLFWWSSSNATLLLTLIAGLVASSTALMGVKTRSMLLLELVLYQSFVPPSAPFMPLLGDKLLMEATLLALLLPADRPSPMLHLSARLLVVKLYLEAGLAQWLMPDGAWQSGQALAPLLSTTPVPTPVAYWVAQLPADLLAVLAKLGLFLELAVPWLALGPRPTRLVAAAVLTGLQLCGVLFFNLGLLALVAVALHLFCLDETDVDAIARDIRRISPTMARAFEHLTRARNAAFAPRWRAALDLTLTRLAPGWMLLYLILGVMGLWHYSHMPSTETKQTKSSSLLASLTPWHVINSYAHAPEPVPGRVEPVLEVLPRPGNTTESERSSPANSAWVPVLLWHQPGDVFRAPAFVAPHQPRLDIQMSRFGRSKHDGTLPPFVQRLMIALCDDPQSISHLVRPPWHKQAQAVRLTFMRYTFAPLDEHRSNGAFWDRSFVADGPILDCKSHRWHQPEDDPGDTHDDSDNQDEQAS